MNSTEKAEAIGRILLEKKGTDVVRIDVKEKTILADYYVIATGAP